MSIGGSRARPCGSPETTTRNTNHVLTQPGSGDFVPLRHSAPRRPSHAAGKQPAKRLGLAAVAQARTPNIPTKRAGRGCDLWSAKPAVQDENTGQADAARCERKRLARLAANAAAPAPTTLEKGREPATS